MGRVDTQVKVRGYRIELGEIEAVLGRQAGVRECVVVVRGDGAAEKQLVAYVSNSGGAKIEIRELRKNLQQELPEYMIPAAIVEMESLPLTANGKINRSALPAPDFSGGQREHTAARTAVEEQLADIWSEVLGVREVGIDDNFFELGGDSILSLQIVSRARQAGLELTPRQVFQHKTIAEVATVVGQGSASRAEQGRVEGEVALTPIQRWFFEAEVQERAHWNQAVLLEVSESVVGAVLQQAVAEVVGHHDALRLRYREEGGEWKQSHGAEESAPFLEIELGALESAAESGKGMQRRALAEVVTAVQESLDLSAGPLLRVVLVRMGAAQRARLLVVIHHLVVDGVSWRILLADLQQAYEQLVAGAAVKLPPRKP